MFIDKDQIGPFSKDEVALTKRFLERREDILVVLRNHFLQLPLQEGDKEFLASLPEEELALLRKFILPELYNNVPVTSESTMYTRLDFIAQYPMYSIESAYSHILVNDLIIEYFEQQFDLLTKEGTPTIVLKDLPKPLGTDQMQMRIENMLAHNMIIPLVEAKILRIKFVAAPPPVKTEAEMKKAEAMNSSK